MKPSVACYFAVNEIAKSPLLKTCYWVLLLGFFLSFSDWIGQDYVTLSAALEGRHVCPPFFQDCDVLYFFDSSEFSYGQEIFYALLTAVLALSALSAAAGRWDRALALMMPAFLWKVFYVTLLTHQTRMDFELFHLPLVFVFLFLPRKEYFMKRVLVTLYLLTATLKFSESWIVGNYFSSLSAGLPLLPDGLIPIATMGVALFESVAPWFLLSPNRRVRLAALGLFSFFHLYSVILISYRYPAHCLPLLWALFLREPERDEFVRPSWAKDALGWAVIAWLVVGAQIPKFFSEDWLYTLQAKKFGPAMFMANYQCISREKLIFKDGSMDRRMHAHTAGTRRCEPYVVWFRLKERCEKRDVERIEWRLQSSVNGGPFYEIVSTPDACALTYSAFGRNDWIRGPSQDAPVAGYPKKNMYLKEGRGDQPIIFDTPQIPLTPLQTALKANLVTVSTLFWILWLGVAAFFVGRRLVSLARGGFRDNNDADAGHN